VANTENKGVETKSYLFETSHNQAGQIGQAGLSANGVWLKAIESPAGAPVTIVLKDKGKNTAGVEVSDAVNRGEQVLALDLLFTGDAWKDVDVSSYAQILDATGDRTIGLEAGQLIVIAHWMSGVGGGGKMRLESTGIRNQVVAQIAAALEPDLFSEMVIHEGMPSLGPLLGKPVTFQEAPDLFCLDLYKGFDLDRLTVMAAPTKVSVEVSSAAP
jgi:hypothetical protein